METSIDYTEYNKVVNLLSQGQNIFVTGSAGTGKSFILAMLKQRYGSDIVLTATTGIASNNIGGMTIHSWTQVGVFQYTFPSILWKCNKANIQKCKILAIDEVSMLSAFALEYLDKLFRLVRNNNSPFGGVQVLCFGDFLQLPPVATKEELLAYDSKGKYCFQSDVWTSLNFKNIYLSKIYRQKDMQFCRLLNNFRQGCLTENDISAIKSRKISPELVESKLHLFPKRNQAINYNKQQLDKIHSKEFYFESIDKISNTQVKNGRTKELLLKSMNKNVQAEEVVILKVGCRVMCLKNYPVAGIYNGSCGTVTDLDNGYAIVLFDNGIRVKFYKTIFKYFENETFIGSRFQLPLKLAYATTIHKAQGLTLSDVVIDCSDSFAPGQVYVGLSRVRSLNNLYILDFNEHQIYADKRAQLFYNRLQSENCFDCNNFDLLVS